MFINIFSFFGFLSFFVSGPFSYLCYLLILSYVFCSTSRFLISRQTIFFFWSKGGCDKTFFFMNLYFGKCEKLSFFLCPFLGKFWVMFEKHYKHRYFSTFLRATKCKIRAILMVNNWATLMLISGPLLCNFRIGNVAQLLTTRIWGPLFLGKHC